MNNILKKISVVLLTFICILTFGTMEVSAASASTSISGGSAEVGEEVTVKVTIKSKQTLGTYNLYVEYDANKLKFSDNNSGDFNGGGGQVKIVGGADTSEEKSKTYELKFIANKAGKAKLSVSGSAYYFDEEKAEVVDMEVKSSSSTLNVTAPVVASDDNTLSSLTLQTDSASGVSKEVKLNPEFSPDVTEYHTTFTYDINKVIVSATQADPNATVSISGTRIDPGENTTKIVVTAEDGSVKEYIIYSTKTNDLPEPDTSDEPTEETTKRPEQATENIYVESMEKYIIVDISGVEIPEGFEESTYTYDNKTVNVARGISKKLVLMYMADDEELTNAAFYVYDDKNSSFYRLANINTDNKTYTIIKTPKGLEIPEGFKKKKVKIDGTNVDSWRLDGNEEFYLLYAMNWEGNTGLYVYDRKEATMQRYIDGLINAVDLDDVETGITEEAPIQNSEELENLYKTVEELKKEYNSDREFKWKIIIGITIVCVLLAILCIVLLVKLKDVEIIEEEEDVNEEEPEQQLKLDMAVQANTMNSGALAANVEDIVKQEEKEQEEKEQEEEAATEEPAAEESATEESAAEKSATEKSAVEETVVEEASPNIINITSDFVELKEPVFIQPEEIKTVTFEETKDKDIESSEKEEKIKTVNEVKEPADTNVQDKKIDEEFTVSGGFGFDESGKKKKLKNKKKKEKQVVEDIDSDDDFEIEFVEIDDDDMD